MRYAHTITRVHPRPSRCLVHRDRAPGPDLDLHDGQAAWPRPLDDGMNDAGRETTFFGPKRQSEERAAERSLAFTRHDRTRSVDDLY